MRKIVANMFVSLDGADQQGRGRRDLPG